MSESTPTTPSPPRPALRRVATTAAITAGTLGLAIVLAGPAAAQTGNPLEGITPSLTFLGPAFNNVWARVIASIWAVLLGATAVKLMVAIYKMRAAKAGGYAAEMTDAMGEAKVSGIAFASLSAVTVIIGAIIFVTSQG